MEKRIPVSVFFRHCTEAQTLRNTEYLLLLPLSGAVFLSGAAGSPVETGALLFLSPGCSTPVRAQDGSDLLYAEISMEFLETSAGVPDCPTAVVFPEDCRDLAERLADLFDLQYNRESATYLQRHIAACQLLQELVTQISAEHFQPVRRDDGSGRRQQMSAWMEQHFRQPVQLQDFADAFGLSRQHASSVFHQVTGISFSDYLLQLRLNEARHLLLTTDMSITAISGESGFPNTSSFHLAFQRSVQMTPKAWRQQNRNEQQNTDAQRQDLLTANRLLQEHRMLYPKQKTTIRMSEEIPVDRHAPVPCVWMDILNVDISADCLRPSAREQLTEIQTQMHFSYVRLHNLITNELIEFFPGARQHRFTNFFRLIDFMKSIGLTPMLAFGSGWIVTLKACIFTDSGYTSSQEEWLGLLQELLKASIRQWGATWVSTWRFEFAMPPSLYGAQDASGFTALFESSIRIIKALLPEAQVGGPALALDNSTLPLWREWLQAVRTRQLPVDFVSMELWADCKFQTEQLPGQSGEPLTGVRIDSLHNADTGLMVSKVQQARELLQANGLGEKKFYISALGIARYQAMAAQAGGHCAAWLVKCILDLQQLVDGIGCWKALNTEAEYADEDTFLTSGCGLMERHSLRLPAWYAYQFLAALQPHLVFQGINGTVTTDGCGRYALLRHNCKNYSMLFCRNFSTPQAMDYLNPQLYTSYSAAAEQLTLTGFAPGRYRVDRYLIGDYHGCLTQVIRQTGDINPAAESTGVYLAGQSLPYRQSRLLDITDTLTLHLTLQPNEVMLITIEPEGPSE